MNDPLTAVNLVEWRQKALNGTMSDDELRAWIKHCREDRVTAAQTSAKSRARKAPVNIDDLMGEIDSIE